MKLLLTPNKSDMRQSSVSCSIRAVYVTGPAHFWLARDSAWCLQEPSNDCGVNVLLLIFLDFRLHVELVLPVSKQFNPLLLADVEDKMKKFDKGSVPDWSGSKGLCV